MKKVIIIEDEKPAAERLTALVSDLGDAEILTCLDSIEDSINWLNSNPEPDLMFCDIQLADGKSFAIFKEVKVKCPIIFTTAYNEYAIKAFKLNSIDYLLKPIDKDELSFAWEKFKTLSGAKNGNGSLLEKLTETLLQRQFRERFLIKSGDQFKFLIADNISYIFSDNGRTFIVDSSGEQHLFDEKLDSVEHELDPTHFHRISRKFIIKDSAISKISSYFNGRLILELNPAFNAEVVVSRDRVANFKKWLGK